MNDKISMAQQATQPDQVCASCTRNFSEGQLVPIYYAKEASRSSKPHGYSDYVRIQYEVISMNHYFICQSCINSNFKRMFWVGLFILIVSLPFCLISGLRTDIEPIALIPLLGVGFGIALLVVSAFPKLKSGESKTQNDVYYASRKAKALANKDFKNSGYDRIWTQEEFISLDLTFK